MIRIKGVYMHSLEEKKEALVLLIRQSLLIEQIKKTSLISQIPDMSEQDVVSLGKFLALEVKNAQIFYKESLPQLDALLDKLDTIPNQINS